MGFTTSSKKKYIVLPEGSRIKFKKSTKYDYDFKKGQLGTVKRVLSPFPAATDTIYQVLPDSNKEVVWVVGEDIELFGQLSLIDPEPEIGFHLDKAVAPKAKGLCPASFYDNTIFCIRNKGHDGLHRSSGGLEWKSSRPKSFYDV